MEREHEQRQKGRCGEGGTSRGRISYARAIGTRNEACKCGATKIGRLRLRSMGGYKSNDERRSHSCEQARQCKACKG